MSGINDMSEKQIARLENRLDAAIELLKRIRICWADEADRLHFSNANMKLATDLDAFLAGNRS